MGGDNISHITEEQIKAAKSIDLLAYLQAFEPGSVRKINTDRYCLKEHDSFIITRGKWHWNSRDLHGRSALDYLIKVHGMDFKEAVQILIDGRFIYIPDVQKNHSPPKPKEPLILPEANKNNDAVYAYLQGRGIDKDIIKRCIDNGTLYEAAKTHHCIFVGYDGYKPKFACVRAINSNEKKDVKNSDKRFNFVLPPKNPESRNLAVFEAPADVLSHSSLYDMGGQKWDGYRLSLGGISSLSLMSFLERHTEITNIFLSLDNDKAGKDATNRIIKELLSDKRFSHIKITVAPPPLGLGKDFNDTLQAIKQINIQKTNNRSKEADFLF